MVLALLCSGSAAAPTRPRSRPTALHRVSDASTVAPPRDGHHPHAGFCSVSEGGVQIDRRVLCAARSASTVRAAAAQRALDSVACRVVAASRELCGVCQASSIHFPPDRRRRLPLRMENELQLADEPSDGITALRFARSSNALLVTSWDSTLRLYSDRGHRLTNKLVHSAPLLGCDFFIDDTHAISCCLDGLLSETELASGAVRRLGVHDSAASCVRFHPAANVAISGSWDKSLKLWDARQSNACASTVAQPDKVYSICCGESTSLPQVVVAMAGRHLHILDLRQADTPLQMRESALKMQTRCVAQMPSGRGFAMGSVEGRVAIEYVDPSPSVQVCDLHVARGCLLPHAQKLRYAFKCHRATIEGKEVVYPVNAISFHPAMGTFATGGCDGIVSVWDGEHKKRICQFKRYHTSISALAFSRDGSHLAVAASSTYEKGYVGETSNGIFVRRVSADEVRPRLHLRHACLSCVAFCYMEVEQLFLLELQLSLLMQSGYKRVDSECRLQCRSE
eukprot:971394-Pleurochrysis_carterae.AAC.4